MLGICWGKLARGAKKAGRGWLTKDLVCLAEEADFLLTVVLSLVMIWAGSHATRLFWDSCSNMEGHLAYCRGWEMVLMQGDRGRDTDRKKCLTRPQEALPPPQPTLCSFNLTAHGQSGQPFRSKAGSPGSNTSEVTEPVCPWECHWGLEDLGADGVGSYWIPMGHRDHVLICISPGGQFSGPCPDLSFLLSDGDNMLALLTSLGNCQWQVGVYGAAL